MKRFSLLLLAAALAVMGCDSSSKKTDTNSASGNGGSDKKGSEAAADNETGRYALYKMLPVAHIWAADVKPVRLESSVLGGSDGHDGKASFWRCMFGSAARQKAEALVKSFESYLAEHKDEIDALQIFYSVPHKKRLRFRDIQALAKPILRHRVMTNFYAESERINSDAIVDRLLETVPLPRSGM